MQKNTQKDKRFVRDVLGKQSDCCHANHRYILTELLPPGDDATGMLALKEFSPVGMLLSYTMLRFRMSGRLTTTTTTDFLLLHQTMPLPC
jgi:hypothetical protein